MLSFPIRVNGVFSADRLDYYYIAELRLILNNFKFFASLIKEIVPVITVKSTETTMTKTRKSAPTKATGTSETCAMCHKRPTQGP